MGLNLFFACLFMKEAVQLNGQKHILLKSDDSYSNLALFLKHRQVTYPFLRPQASYLSFPCFDFLIWKIKMII